MNNPAALGDVLSKRLSTINKELPAKPIKTATMIESVKKKGEKKEKRILLTFGRRGDE